MNTEIEFVRYRTNEESFTAPKLLPCPFCGSSAEITFIGNNHTKARKTEISCTLCFTKRIDATIRNNSSWIGKVCIESWNKRTPISQSPPQVTDEEIEIEADRIYPYNIYKHSEYKAFVNACKWMRDKLTTPTRDNNKEKTK